MNNVELVDSWGHGKNCFHDWQKAPATIIAEDGDGHYTAWKFTGDMKEAAKEIAYRIAADMNMDGHMMIFDRENRQVRREDGNPYREIDGEFIFDSEKFPDAIEV